MPATRNERTATVRFEVHSPDLDLNFRAAMRMTPRLRELLRRTELDLIALLDDAPSPAERAEAPHR